MAREHLLVRGVDCFPSSLKVPFMQAVPDNLRCKLCRNVSTRIVMDTDDHTYCQDCINMVDEGGTFRCVVDDVVEHIATLRTCPDAWKKILGLTVKCPKSNCMYQATLQDLQVHYPNCRSEGVRCPLCNTCVSAEGLALHTNQECPQRDLECPFCQKEQKACTLDEHMEACDQRPATCEHCHTDFETFLEVRDFHYAVCPRKPIGCPYTRFGCKFVGIREEVDAHTRQDQHIKMVIDNFECQRRELREVKDKFEQLQTLVRNLEESRSEDLQHRLSLEDELRAANNEIKALKQTVDSYFKRGEDTDVKVQELYQRIDIFATPMGELLKNIAAQNL
ncbi:TNF receptor-associated factor 2-like [Ornithodoros turicata]|uniref:TNF receptor-associated factor 2-like n=1 Tax=Ornithodoros turicata TaxID=34597 RepID=UPI00313A459B